MMTANKDLREEMQALVQQCIVDLVALQKKLEAPINDDKHLQQEIEFKQRDKEEYLTSRS